MAFYQVKRWRFMVGNAIPIYKPPFFFLEKSRRIKSLTFGVTFWEKEKSLYSICRLIHLTSLLKAFDSSIPIRAGKQPASSKPKDLFFALLPLISLRCLVPSVILCQWIPSSLISQTPPLAI